MHPSIAIPATLALIYRAYSRRSLTPLGILTAALTAIIHAIHPWNLPFALLATFFLAGTAVTKVKHHKKATLTLSSSGASGGEGARTHVQVLCNSVVATGLIAVHSYLLYTSGGRGKSGQCWSYGRDLLPVGIVAHYAAVSADTFSSELGILSTSKPRLLTSWNLRTVPPGTNGGVTATGTLAGFAGAGLVAVVSVLLAPFCSPTSEGGLKSKVLGAERTGFAGGSVWGWQEKAAFVVVVTVWGGLGSVVDSLLGGWLQASVVDRKTGKVVEGRGGGKVLVAGKEAKKDDDGGSRKVESGWAILDNNGVNLLMAATMTIGGMMVMGAVWNISPEEIWS